MASSRPHRLGRPGGFTLIEALVCLALLGLLVAAVLPSMRGFVQRRQIEGASAQLQSDLHFLRSSSVAANQALRISIRNDAGGSCYLIHTGQADQCSCSYPAGAEPQARCNDGTDLLRGHAWRGSQVAVRANVASMLVDPRHGTFSPAGSIEIQAGSDGPVLRHVVNLLGRVRVCSPTAGLPGVSTC